MSKFKLFFIFLSVIFLSYQSCRKSADDLITIDISKDYSKKKIKIDTEYIPLETKDTVVVGKGATLHYVSEKYILVIERANGDIFVFDRSGKIVNYINNIGRGPMEYFTISNVVFDENSKEIFVFDRPSARRIQVYSLTGEYKQTLEYSDAYDLTAYNFDENTFLTYDTKGLYSDDNSYSKKPYMFMSKTVVDGINALNIDLPVRYSERVSWQNKAPSGQVFTSSRSVPIPNSIHFGEDFIISDISSDTIYQLTRGKELKPIMVRTPSVHSSDPRMVWTCALNTDKFMILYVTTLDYETIKKNNLPPTKTLMYEYKSGKISQVDYHGTNVNTLQKNIDASMFDVVAFKESFGSKALEQLNANSNPVVVIDSYK